MLRGQGIGAWPVCGKKAGSAKHYKGTNTGGSKSTADKKAATHKKATTTHKKATTQKAPPRKSTVTRSSTVQSTGKHYVVRSGDTLSAIASKNHVDDQDLDDEALLRDAPQRLGPAEYALYQARRRGQPVGVTNSG